MAMVTWLAQPGYWGRKTETILQVKHIYARNHGPSKSGCEELEKMLRTFDDTIKLKLNAERLDDIEQLKITHKPEAVPSRAKQWS